MMFVEYRITDPKGGRRFTTIIGEAMDAAKAGDKVEKRRMSISERTGRPRPTTTWKLAEFTKAETERIIQYRIYLNPLEHFDTLKREEAIRHWQDGRMIYSRQVILYPLSGNTEAVGYWQAHPPKGQVNVPNGVAGYPKLLEKDVLAVESKSQKDEEKQDER